MCAQPKVVLKVETEEDMLVLQVSILTIIYKLFWQDINQFLSCMF